MRTTHTYAICEVSKAAFDEIAEKLRAEGRPAGAGMTTPPTIDPREVALDVLAGLAARIERTATGLANRAREIGTSLAKPVAEWSPLSTYAEMRDQVTALLLRVDRMEAKTKELVETLKESQRG